MLSDDTEQFHGIEHEQQRPQDTTSRYAKRHKLDGGQLTVRRSAVPSPQPWTEF